MAAQNGHFLIVRFLCESATPVIADCLLKNRDGSTPLELAEISLAKEETNLGGRKKIIRNPPAKGSLYDRLLATVEFLAQKEDPNRDIREEKKEELKR